MRKLVTELAKCLFIVLNNKELAVTGSLALRYYGVEIDRKEGIIGDVDFYNHFVSETSHDDYFMPPFTEETLSEKVNNILVDSYTCVQFENEGLKFDILTKTNYDLNGIEWIEKCYEDRKKEYKCILEELDDEFLFCSVYTFIDRIIPDLTEEEGKYINRYCNGFGSSFINIDTLTNIGNAKLKILRDRYGDIFIGNRREEIKEDKHYKDILKINEFISEADNCPTIACKLKI